MLAMETPLEAKEHEEIASRKETQAVGTGPVDPLVEGNPEDEKLRDANQPSEFTFLESPADEAYQG